MNVIKWFFAIIFFHTVMIPFVIVLTLLLPIITFFELRDALQYEIPAQTNSIFVFCYVSLYVYLAMRFKFLGIPYRKVTILLPLLQFCLFTYVAISAGFIFINKWADEGAYSKGEAIAYAIIAFIVIRLLMSLLYWKYPLVQRKANE
ncbi:hypothetical protein I6N90_16815 [Paenibacillus sp. GSMTC-2017]|uniref:hypothetical protein n=1 Tax=Paenibacillus sp. GSMTC-2017 TaxID=2794350 RepID=UPI0018D653E0|nr:hypothetical protein [Paenibacillus sp. GSMTC-2017]MBH5319460.1 hypothetical protein [Paenibacillus sp. GSMTC-2017]